MTRRDEAELDRALRFQTCPSCSFDFATRTGTRSCHLYACPYLPELLDVSCPNCNYNFETLDGAAECGDPPTCSFSTDQAPKRVAALHAWLDVTLDRSPNG